MCSVFVLYEIKMENKKKKKKILSNWDFLSGYWEKKTFLALRMGLNFGPKIG